MLPPSDTRYIGDISPIFRDIFLHGHHYLFYNMMHRDVDDMIVKSRDRTDHLVALERFFQRIRKFKLRLNPKKHIYGVSSEKLLGYMVNERGIEVNPDKIRAILDMPTPKTEKEVRVFWVDNIISIVSLPN